jgi:uncharacterized membrane protein YoaK (UPF0700 family)
MDVQRGGSRLNTCVELAVNVCVFVCGQFKVLLRRFCLTYVRNPGNLLARLVVVCFLAGVQVMAGAKCILAPTACDEATGP